MKKVGIAELKARLSHYLRRVRRGHTVTIHDRGRPVARIVPEGPAMGLHGVHQPAGKGRGLRDVPLPEPLGVAVDVLALLLEERQGER